MVAWVVADVDGTPPVACCTVAGSTADIDSAGRIGSRLPLGEGQFVEVLSTVVSAEVFS